jgi:hypothetical protein
MEGRRTGSQMFVVFFRRVVNVMESEAFGIVRASSNGERSLEGSKGFSDICPDCIAMIAAGCAGHV